MKHLLTILLALTCATSFAQSVIIKGTDAGAVRGTGAGSVRGAILTTTNTYSDGRFEIRSDNTGVVVDNDSGLTWTRDANIGGTMTWSNAVTYCDNLTNSTYSDWRLPSAAEASRYVAQGGSTTGLVDSYVSTNDPALPLGHPFTNVQSSDYWTSTEAGDPAGAFDVSLQNGFLIDDLKTTPFLVWPCRGP